VAGNVWVALRGGSGNDERDQTLNQLLVELDGFGSDTGVVCIAATNRMDVLDTALIRAGRFDRKITVQLPTKEGRVQILKVHVRGKPVAPDVDLVDLAGEVGPPAQCHVIHTAPHVMPRHATSCHIVPCHHVTATLLPCHSPCFQPSFELSFRYVSAVA